MIRSMKYPLQATVSIMWIENLFKLNNFTSLLSQTLHSGGKKLHV